MVSTDRSSALVDGLRTLADMYERTADLFETQADGLDVLLDEERTSNLDEPITPRPPNPDEYRLYARDHRVQAELFREAAARIENGETTPELRTAVKEFIDEVEASDGAHITLRDSFM